jgi:hypothetical protein
MPMITQEAIRLSPTFFTNKLYTVEIAIPQKN